MEFINSSPITNDLIYFFAAGSLFINSFFSYSFINKNPPSFGILPYVIIGESQRGVVLFKSIISFPSTK